MIMTKYRAIKFSTLLAACVIAFPAASWAGPGHDHGEAATAVAGDGPRRMATGEVFLPKPAQRQLKVRTSPALIEQHAKVIELNGKVALDPQTGGIVQTTLGGSFVPPGQGVPQLGQQVKKGQVLGFIQTPQAALEKSSQQAQLAQLRSELTLTEKRLERLLQLADTVPKKEIDAAQAQVQSLKGQVAALAGGIASRETLRAPSTGIVASSMAISGKVFSEGDVLFEIVDPAVVRVEASWYESGVVPDFQSARVQAGEKGVKLKYLGAASSVKDQALTLAFEARGLQNTSFPTGQLLKVYAEQVEKIEGIAVVSSALVKNAANQTAVWVKVKPETFEPRVVTIEPLDGQRVLITSGLKPFDRVVVQAASLINQIR